jgi:hypothetical protein
MNNIAKRLTARASSVEECSPPNAEATTNRLPVMPNWRCLPGKAGRQIIYGAGEPPSGGWSDVGGASGYGAACASGSTQTKVPKTRS